MWYDKFRERPVIRLVVAALLLSALPSGCGPGEQNKPASPAVTVEAAEVTVAPLDETLAAVGSLSSPQETLLTSQVDGKIVHLKVRQGQTVPRGALLARLDDGVQQAAVASAEAELFNARQIFRRDQQVKGTGGISERQLQSDQAAVRLGEAQLQQARANLAYTRIRAPFKGALGLRRVSLGAFIHAGDAIVSLQQTDPLHLDFDLPQQQAPRLEQGQQVRLTVAGQPDTFQGRVTTVDPALARGSRTLRVQATVSNPEGRLKPGMFGRVELVVATQPRALFIPMQALSAEGEVNHVWVVGAQETAEQRQVEVGRYRDNLVQILSGLKPGERVVTAGIQKLHPGAKLKVSPHQAIHNPRLDLSAPDQRRGS